MRSLVVRGARQHNLRGFTLALPHGRLIVLTGPSGSGKSSLAFDTIYAEGQRRYIESLSTYAKQFLERMPRPAVDAIEGIAPAVAIEQRNPTTSSRSTVGTATEIYDYLRLLWSRDRARALRGLRRRGPLRHRAGGGGPAAGLRAATRSSPSRCRPSCAPRTSRWSRTCSRWGSCG